jgi:hypothetical protein
VCTRFGLSIKDEAWFDHRIPLISAITVPSLLAQTDQEFHWALFTDPDLPPRTRVALEAMLKPFKGRAFLHSSSSYTSANVLALAQSRGLVDENGYVLTARIDDDDAWHSHTVSTVRQRSGEWLSGAQDTRGLCMTFEKGLEWIMYDMLDVDALQDKGVRIVRQAAVRPWPFPFMSMSVFVLARAVDGESAISAGHLKMGQHLGARGYTVEIVSAAQPMWLYCRHKQVQTSVQRAAADSVDMSLTDLAREFGIDESRTKAYLTSSQKYGYSIAKRTDFRLSNLERRLSVVRERINADPVDAERTDLRREEARLVSEMTRMSQNVVGNPVLGSSADEAK